ncbi:hypothetical protein CEQ90_15645 [Lewinellaceae bacterium SD302]|nr:hypothetical protein CEQ90_15645 [Lewinellaceae bacterium SD302]
MQNALYLFILVTLFNFTSCDLSTIAERREEATATDLLPGTRPSDDNFLAKGWPDGQISAEAHERGLQEARLMALTEDNSPGFDLNWTTRGPANIGARINTVAIHPDDDDIMFVGFSRGGVWRTTNGGQDWIPVFDEQLYLSIGDIEFDPIDPNIIYVGTGDPNISSNFMIGDGVYRSTDGGDSWENIGWGGLNIVTQIRIHPTSPDTIYAAAMGVPFERDTVRGLYRTHDGGQNWEQVLFVSNQAGIIDLVMDVNNPNRLFASSWDRIRNNEESIVHGPNAKIHFSEDGGNSWTILTDGLPTDNQGRIGLTQSLSDPQTIYASYTGTNSQLFDIYKTSDGGSSWAPVLDPTSFNPISENALGGFGWYFGKIRVNPADQNDIYVLGVDLWRSRNGGVDWERASPPWFEYSVHADKHDLQWDSQGRILLTTDGGMYRSNPEVTEWEDMENIPCTQFYRVAVSPHLSGTVFGGAQDNGSTGGNNLEEEWPRIFGGDGFQMRFHPNNPQHFFAETQNGNINVTLDGGFDWFPADDGIEGGDRRNWDMQYFLSPHDPDQLYTGTYRAYRASNSEFPFWQPISDDLTDGLILNPRYHTITCIDESPVEAGLLYVGTTDGNVWRGDNAGQSWTSITDGLPDRYVSSVKPSPDDSDIVYVTFSAFKDYDFTPLVFRSLDRGESWTSIAGDLPNLSINDIYVYPGRGDSILFIANEGGVYGSINAGESWERLGQNMPLVQVRDLEIDTSTNELVAGSFARSILTYSLDSLINPTVEPPVSARSDHYLAAELLLSPNPSNGPLQLSWQGLEVGTAHFQVLDLRGHIILNSNLAITAQSGQQAINLNGQVLTTGPYLVEIRQNGKRKVLRWVKQ